MVKLLPYCRRTCGGCHILFMPALQSCPPIERMSLLGHAHLTVISTDPSRMPHSILVMPTLRSCPPIEDVAFCPCPPYGHVHPSRMSHFGRARLTVMSTHEDVAFWSCPPYGHVHSLEMSAPRSSSFPIISVVQPCLAHTRCSGVSPSAERQSTFWSCLSMRDVAFWSFLSHSHVYP